MLRYLLLGFVALLMIALAGARLYAESFVKPRLEAVASATLGVETRIDRMSLGLLAGAVGFRGLAVRNPEGYREGDVLRVGSVDLGVDLRSLLRPEIVLPKIVVDDVSLNLEGAGRSANYREILDNLGSGAGEEPGEESGRRVVVREIRVTDVQASVRLLPELRAVDAKGVEALDELELEIPEIRLENVDAEGSGRRVTEEVTRLVLAAVVRAVAENTRGLPGGLSRKLITASRATGSTGFEILGDVTRSGGETLGRLPAVGEAAEELGKRASRLFEGLGRRVKKDEGE